MYVPFGHVAPNVPVYISKAFKLSSMKVHAHEDEFRNALQNHGIQKLIL